MAHRFYRYQLNKQATTHVAHHPWVFREQMSSAASALPDGAWLRLFDGANAVVGYGIYAADGAIAIRVLRRGAARPTDDYIQERVAAAIARRAGIAATGVRLIHGESDSLPAVTVDRFGDVLVAQSYAAGADGLARYAALLAARSLAIPHVVMRGSRRRIGAEQVSTWKVIKGKPPAVAHFEEDGATYAVDLAGQKSGAYLDLRALRRAVRRMPLAGKRVLNLFAYTGMLAAAAERAGAAHVTSVDQSEAALAFGRTHHGLGDAAKHATVTADAFAYAGTLTGEYDLVICDPPAMTSNIKQVPKVLAAYKKIYAQLAPHVAPGGALVAACCTSRVTRAQFDQVVRAALGDNFSFERDLPPEPDHPVGFAQADYLKIAVYRRA